MSWAEYKKAFFELMDDNNIDFIDAEHKDNTLYKLKKYWDKGKDVDEAFDYLF